MRYGVTPICRTGVAAKTVLAIGFHRLLVKTELTIDS